MDKASLEVLLGQGLSLARIGRRFGKDRSTVSYWVAKHGLQAVNRGKHAARGGISHERLEGLVVLGMTQAEIASEMSVSLTTVRRWMQRHGIRTQNTGGPKRSPQTRAAKADGLLTARMTCDRHGEASFFLEGRGYYRCKQCRSEAVARRRRKVKAILVREAGGHCLICGYERYAGALEFHHLDPMQSAWR